MRFAVILFFLLLFSGCHMAGYYANKRIRHHHQTAIAAVKYDSAFTVIKTVQPNIQQPEVICKKINPVQPISTAPVQEKHSPTHVLKKTGRETTTIKTNPFFPVHIQPVHRRKSHPLFIIGMILLFLLILFVFVVMLYVGATLIYTSAMSKTLMTFLFLVWAVLCAVVGRFLLHLWFKLLRGISHRVD